MFALVAFKRDAEGILQGGLDGTESGEWMSLSAGAGLAGIGRKQPSEVLRFCERHAASERAREKIGKCGPVYTRKLGDGCVPEAGFGDVSRQPC